MNDQDEIGATNEQWWEKMVQDGCGFTRPWLDLEKELILQYSNGELSKLPEPLTNTCLAHG
jgi:hypothetical protein